MAGGEYCVGSIDGEAGKSLKVRVTGAKAGIWADFAGSDKGDLIDLICAVRHIPIGEAIKEAKAFLGLTEFQSIVPKKAYSRPPSKPAGVKKLVEATPVMAYLTGERKLTPEIIAKFRIADGGGEIAFPSYSPIGELDSIKYIGLERENGKKVVRQEKGCAPALFGWQALPANTRTVIITEGQIDAMTWTQMGYPALSVPNGTGDLDGWIDYEWDNLQQFDTIYINFDSDKPGQDSVIKVSKRLGIHRCLNIVLTGDKDANDALQHGQPKAYYDEAIKGAQPFKPKQIKSPLEFRDATMEEFYPTGGVLPGFVPETLSRFIRFIPGQVTIWTGISSHGKSNVLNQLALELVCGRGRCAIASMEMPGHKNLARMIRTAYPNFTAPISKEFIDGMLTELAGRLWIFDLLGSISMTLLMELMTYAVSRYRVEHFIIDSLMKLDVDSEDSEEQKKALNTLTSFAMTHSIHIHLVCHARKGENEDSAPGKMDVKGAVDIINQCDNLISVWRNKPKEKAAARGKITEADRGKIPDCICHVIKNRETGEEGEIDLWFNRRRNRYIPKTEDGQFIEIKLMPEPAE